MSEWPRARFADLYAEPSRNGISVSKSLRGQGHPMVNMKELFSFDVISEQHTELVPLTGSEVARWSLRDGDLLFGRRSLTLAGAGKVSLIKKPLPGTVFESSLIRSRLNQEEASPTFYFYLFKSAPGRELMETIVEQTAVAGIRSSDLGNLRVPLPPLDEQRRIAGVLGALDDLIETNRRHIDHVRSLSAALYERLALAAGDSRPLGDVASVSQIKVKPGIGAIRYLDIASMGDGSIELPSPIDWADAPSRARVGASDGATLWSTVRPNRRAHAMLWRVPDDIVVSTGIAVLQPQAIGPAELFAAADREDFTAQLVALADGSAYPAVRASQFENVMIPDLHPRDSASFEHTMAPLWEDVAAAREASAHLTRTRDELLPLVMAGKVRVSEVLAVG